SSAWTSSGRTRPASAPVTSLLADYCADVPAIGHVPIPLVDLLERVPPGDQLVELEVPGAVEPEQLGDVVERVAVAEERAADLALVADHVPGVDVHRVLAELADRGDGDLAALADDLHRGVDDLGG